MSPEDAPVNSNKNRDGATHLIRGLPSHGRKPEGVIYRAEF